MAPSWVLSSYRSVVQSVAKKIRVAPIPVHVLIVYKVDRLGRDHLTGSECIRNLTDAGQLKFVNMHSANERRDIMMV